MKPTEYNKCTKPIDEKFWGRPNLRPPEYTQGSFTPHSSPRVAAFTPDVMPYGAVCAVLCRAGPGVAKPKNYKYIILPSLWAKPSVIQLVLSFDGRPKSPDLNVTGPDARI